MSREFVASRSANLNRDALRDDITEPCTQIRFSSGRAFAGYAVPKSQLVLTWLKRPEKKRSTGAVKVGQLGRLRFLVPLQFRSPTKAMGRKVSAERIGS